MAGFANRASCRADDPRLRLAKAARASRAAFLCGDLPRRERGAGAPSSCAALLEHGLTPVAFPFCRLDPMRTLNVNDGLPQPYDCVILLVILVGRPGIEPGTP